MLYEKLKEENEKLKEENEKLKLKITELERNNSYNIIQIEERYKREYEKQLEFEKVKYNTKIKRKKQIEALCNSLEDSINANIHMGLDITSDVNALIKLLQYLKEE